MTGMGGNPSAPDMLVDARLAARVSRLLRSSGAATTASWGATLTEETADVVETRDVVVETSDVVVEEELLEVGAPRLAFIKEYFKSKQ